MDLSTYLQRYNVCKNRSIGIEKYRKRRVSVPISSESTRIGIDKFGINEYRYRQVSVSTSTYRY
jgi:hypothetical protein